MNTIQVDIVSAEGEIFSGPAAEVDAPASEGSIGIHPRHAAGNRHPQLGSQQIAQLSKALSLSRLPLERIHLPRHFFKDVIHTRQVLLGAHVLLVRQIGAPELDRPRAVVVTDVGVEQRHRVVLCDCTPRYNDEMRANWPVRAELARKNGVASLIPMLEKVFFTQASLDENGPNVRHVKEKRAACGGEGYALGCDWLAMLDAREQAKRMTMPTLILLGSNEGQPFKDAARWMNDNIPGSTGIVEVPMAGHATVRERPEFVIQHFRRFLG